VSSGNHANGVKFGRSEFGSVADSSVVTYEDDAYGIYFSDSDNGVIADSSIVTSGHSSEGVVFSHSNFSVVENSFLFSKQSDDVFLNNDQDCSSNNMFYNSVLNSSSVRSNCDVDTGSNSFVWFNDNARVKWAIPNNVSVVGEGALSLNDNFVFSPNFIDVVGVESWNQVPANLYFNNLIGNFNSVLMNGVPCGVACGDIVYNGDYLYSVAVDHFTNFSLNGSFVSWVVEPVDQVVTFYEDFVYDVDAVGSSSVRYFLSGDDFDRFVIDLSSGVIRNNTNLELGETYTFNVEASNSESRKNLSQEIDVSVVYTIDFDNELSSNFDDVLVVNITNLTLGVQGIGFVKFLNTSFNMSNVTLDLFAEVSNNFVSVDSVAMPFVSGSDANIQLQNLNFNNPQVFRNGVACGGVCDVNFNDGTVLDFNVSSFSYYSADDYCGNSVCEADESCSSCSADCGTCGGGGGGGGNGGGSFYYCGDGVCDSSETCESCPDDCGSCGNGVSLYCGDGICNNGESCSSCSRDCGTCETDIPPLQAGTNNTNTSDEDQQSTEEIESRQGIIEFFSKLFDSTIFWIVVGILGVLIVGNAVIILVKRVKTDIRNSKNNVSESNAQNRLHNSNNNNSNATNNLKVETGINLTRTTQTSKQPKQYYPQESIKKLDKYISLELDRNVLEQSIIKSLLSVGWARFIVEGEFKKISLLKLKNNTNLKIDSSIQNALLAGMNKNQIFSSLISKGYNADVVKRKLQNLNYSHMISDTKTASVDKDADLKLYVTDERKSGFTDAQIKQKLLSVGWTQNKIDKIFNQLI